MHREHVNLVGSDEFIDDAVGLQDDWCYLPHGTSTRPHARRIVCGHSARAVIPGQVSSAHGLAGFRGLANRGLAPAPYARGPVDGWWSHVKPSRTEVS